jgi:integration host factor subunit alpha
MTLTKANIVETISKENGYTKNKSFEIVETLLELIKIVLESEEDVLISGFGKFCVKEKKARRWINYVKDEYEMLRERRVVTFRCSRQLRDKING